MKRKEMERVVTTIPLFLVIEILSWLPARSLVRFRRVCKLWLSITTDPSFIETNLDRSRKSRPPSVLLFLSHYGRDHCGITVMNDDPKRTPNRLLIVPRPTRHRQRRQGRRGRLRMTSSCNGLVCISDRNGYIELLNPTTGERHTPPPPHHTQGVLPSSLGFHPETKEYKVVRFFYSRFDQKWCEVYTLGTNSWRQTPFPLNCIPHDKGANVNGSLYWRININGHYHRGDHVLLSFDLKNERFTPISPPDFARVYPEKIYDMSLRALQGTVCLLVYPNSLKRTDIWMMALSSNGDNTTTHQWALNYSVSCFIAGPLFIHNERILVSYSNCHRPKSEDKEEPPALVYHHLDCKNGCTTEVYREGKPESPLIYHYLKGQDGSNYEEIYRDTGIHFSQPFAHVESLVSLQDQCHL